MTNKYTINVSRSELIQLIQLRSKRIIDAYVNCWHEDFPQILDDWETLVSFLRAENEKALALIEARRANYRTCGQPRQQDSSLRRETEQRLGCSHKAGSEQRHLSQSADESEE